MLDYFELFPTFYKATQTALGLSEQKANELLLSRASEVSSEDFTLILIPILSNARSISVDLYKHLVFDIESFSLRLDNGLCVRRYIDNALDVSELLHEIYIDWIDVSDSFVKVFMNFTSLCESDNIKVVEIKDNHKFNNTIPEIDRDFLVDLKSTVSFSPLILQSIINFITVTSNIQNKRLVSETLLSFQKCPEEYMNVFSVDKIELVSISNSICAVLNNKCVLASTKELTDSEKELAVAKSNMLI